MFVCILALPTNNSSAQGYKLPSQTDDWLTSTQQANASVTKLHTIAELNLSRKVQLLEIGGEVASEKKTRPAILVAANLGGNRPLATEGAIYLVNRILADENHYADRTWYIIPCGNPEAAGRFFEDPRYDDPRNDTPHNDDMDEDTDEDGFNDLNGDGLITRMRVKHPDGTWIPDANEPRLMRRADPKKGEQGIYKIYSEGLDDDGDGKYNEDGPGGTNVNINFPHLFKHYTASGGLYPGSAREAYGIMKFVYEHPEIAMIFAIGETNFCHTPPKGGRKGGADLTRIRIPADMAEMMGADPGQRYSMEEIIEMAQPLAPQGVELDESMVAEILGLGAMVNPQEKDLVFYEKFAEDYKKYLEEKGVKGERFDPEKARDGSFELWSYYNIGVPVFSMDLWSVPKPEEKKEESSGITIEALGKMSSEDFLALGEEKITAFLKEAGAPEQFSAQMIIEGMEAGQGTDVPLLHH